MAHQPYGFYENYAKRPIDVLCALVALIVLSPVLLVTALLVRINLGAPVLFTQDRPGKDGKIFKLYKFRSMTNGRDENGNLLPDVDRMTSFSYLIRKTSIDELPELINIVKGEMSIVGPRPLAVCYLPFYTNKEAHRHDVRPGLTGLAQIRGRNSASWDEKFQSDLEYVENISFLTDVKIILKTIQLVIRQDGIGQGQEHPGSLHIIRKDWLDEKGRMKAEYREK